MRLSELRKGETGIITEIMLAGTAKNRLIAMGADEGEEITVLRRAPLGDPTEFYIRGCRLCIRKRDAENIFTERRI
ncbi:MAG: ferrous iron transport protein A [Oscillospiraceae bacterium]|nr:ferrous iron transport protein A [Oscillospiraceae bacterium]